MLFFNAIDLRVVSADAADGWQTLYFSHGFSPVFKKQTKVDVPTDVDVILVAPKGSGRTVRTLFREGDRKSVV